MSGSPPPAGETRTEGEATGGRREATSRCDGNRFGLRPRQHDGGDLAGLDRRSQWGGLHHALRRLAVSRPLRGGGEEFRSAEVHREEGRQEDGSVHSLRHRRGSRGRGRCGFEDHPGERRARRRLHRLGDRRLLGDRARASEVPGGGTGEDLALLHPGGDRESGGGPGLHSIRGARAQQRHVHGMLGGRARHRRRLQDHRTRRCRCDDLRRGGGGRHAHGGRRIRGHARALDAQRGAAARQSPLRSRSRWIRHR
ncbi:hypothetical protein HRbin08_00657 [bacterium HR08]|nr:hypothetical protein HRbin08_00657 [bacterium HR08]